MKNDYQRIKKCLDAIRTITEFTPKIGIVLGSGLSALSENIDIKCTIDYKSLEGFPVSTVAGHEGKYLFGYLNDVPVVAMSGRVHFYEGYSPFDVVLPIRLMGLLGAETIILTNASGGINSSFKPGDLMMISGQISSFVPSPLIGYNIDELGTRFPDMSEIYDKKLQQILLSTAKEENIELKQGVYLQATGPQYESPEEVKMYGLLGADAVGMSTAIEAIAAVHMGKKVCGVSCICNQACGISPTPLSHDEVKKAAASASEKFCRLITSAVLNINNEKEYTND